MTLALNNPLFDDVKQLLVDARTRVVTAVNMAMVHTYFEIGRLIVEHEQSGDVKAGYGKETLKQLSVSLTGDFGKGFSVTNLKQMRTFYAVYTKGQTVPDPFALSWSHYIFLMRLADPERQFYEIESIENNWSLRELNTANKPIRGRLFKTPTS